MGKVQRGGPVLGKRCFDARALAFAGRFDGLLDRQDGCPQSFSRIHPNRL
jgi:hypothetical protein